MVLLFWVRPGAESVGFSIGSLCLHSISVWGLGHDVCRFLFHFWAFLSSVVLGFWPLVFWFSMGVASTAYRPLRVLYASPPPCATIATLLGGSRPAPPGSFRFGFVFFVLDLYLVLLYFCVLVFCVFCSSANLLLVGSTAIRPLPGLSLRPQCNKLQRPLHWSDSVVTRLAFLYIVGFFSLYFVVVSLYCCFLLVINPFLFDMLLGKKLRPDLWVVDVNVILVF
jgi:hypothetical protein